MEEHLSVTTNAIGLVNLAIGAGEPTPTSNFNDIAWGNHTHFLTIGIAEISFESPESDYMIIGSTQLRSVPYALFSESSENPGNPKILDRLGNLITENCPKSRKHVKQSVHASSHIGSESKNVIFDFYRQKE